MPAAMIRIIAAIVIGALLSIVLSVQLGTVILMAGRTTGDVETLTIVQFVAGIVIGGVAGLFWALRRNRKRAEDRRKNSKFGRQR